MLEKMDMKIKTIADLELRQNELLNDKNNLNSNTNNNQLSKFIHIKSKLLYNIVLICIT